MKAKFIISAVVCASIILVTSQSFSEIIYLKDGKVIDAKIVERGSYYIVTMTGETSKKYFMSQIDYIEEDESEIIADPVSIDLSQYEGIAEDKVRLIFNYIDVSGVRASMEDNITFAIDQAPEEEREKYKKLFNVSEIIDRVVPIYNKYYSKVDLINMIQFYESPTGVNVLQSTPEIMKETMGVSIQYIKENMMP